MDIDKIVNIIKNVPNEVVYKACIQMVSTPEMEEVEKNGNGGFKDFLESVSLSKEQLMDLHRLAFDNDNEIIAQYIQEHIDITK